MEPLYSHSRIYEMTSSNLEEYFYVELRPVSDRFVKEALEVSGLSLSLLHQCGTDPPKGMTMFRD